MTLRGALLLLTLALPLVSATPNILLILADDLAWSDLGCYGSKACETPHLDRLAGQGMRFTDAYSAAPLCSPSRAALLTGKSPARLNFEFVTKWAKDELKSWPEQTVKPPPYTLNLPLEEVTLAETLASAGYQTGIVGKWHLNTHHETYNGWSPVFGPRQQGFEFAVETFGSHPWAWRGREAPSFRDLPTGEYAPDELTDSAIGFLESRDRERPFFLYVSHYYVHTPVRERGAWLESKYREKLGESASKERILYGGFVETLDHHVGRLLAALEKTGAADDTVVIFTSDNGGHPVYAVNAPLRGSKWHLYEGGIRVPLIVRWPGQIAAGSTSHAVVLGTDIYATAAELAGAPVAHAGNLDSVSFAPALRGHAYGGSPEQGMAAPPPRGGRNRPKPALRGRAVKRSVPAVWHFPYYHPEAGYPETADHIGVGDPFVARTRPLSAIREGRFKLLYFHEDQRVELYDLVEDIGEQHDLSGRRPALARELKAKLLAYLKRVNARMPAPIDKTD